MGYKTTERYRLGWTDPRAMFGNRDDRRVRLGRGVRTSLKTVPTETLCNLWLVTWGEDHVNVNALTSDTATAAVIEVMQELENRGFVRFYSVNNVHTPERENYYVLRNPYANR